MLGRKQRPEAGVTLGIFQEFYQRRWEVKGHGVVGEHGGQEGGRNGDWMMGNHAFHLNAGSSEAVNGFP